MFEISIVKEEVIDDTKYYQCPTCDLFVAEGWTPSITYEDEYSYEYPLGRITKWYFLQHYYSDEDGQMQKIPVFSEGTFSLKLECLYETRWEAELAIGEEVQNGTR